jgi:hypothetical protein
MPKYTQPEVTAQLLMQAYDPDHYAHMYGLMTYALGDKYDKGRGRGYGEGGNLPDFPDIAPRFYEIGTSRRILNNAMLMMAKVCYMDPEPDFPELPDLHEDVRRQWLKKRWRGDQETETGDWGSEAFKVFLDGDGLGIGWAQVVVKDGATTIEHVPITECIWDRHSLNPARSRFWARIHNLPVDVAKILYGKLVEGHTRTYAGHNHGEVHPLEVVRVIECFDVGIGKSEPTRTVFLDTLGGKVLDIGANDYECIPAAHYEHIQLWKMRRPMGRIEMQLASEEMRNALQRYIKLTLERGSGFDIMDTTGMNEDDLKALMDGVLLPLVKYDFTDGAKPAGSVVQRVSPQDIPNGVQYYMNLLDREQNTESGNSDADRANLTSTGRTLGEVQQAQAGADIQTAWSKRQYARFLQRLVAKAVKIGAMYDVAPVYLSVKNAPVLFNDPQNPNSAVGPFLETPSTVNISEDDLQYVSRDSRQTKAMQMWMTLMGNPIFDQVAVGKKIIESMGEKDVDQFIAQAALGATGQAAADQTDLSNQAPPI